MHAAGATALRSSRAQALAPLRCERWRSRDRSMRSSSLSTETRTAAGRSMSMLPSRPLAAASPPPLRSHLIPSLAKRSSSHFARDASGSSDGASERMYWPWSVLLGCGAATAAAVVAAATTSSQSATSHAEPADNASARTPPDASSPTATTAPTTASASKALRKRKTSTGNERFVISSAAVRGDRAKMEDTSFISSCKRFAAVFDGHGGAAVAEYLRQHYFALLAPALAKLDEESAARHADALLAYAKQPVAMSPMVSSPAVAAPPVPRVVTSAARRNEVLELLKTSMETLDADVVRKNEWKYQGSTAVGVLLYDDMIYSINVGDSRAVLCRSGDALELTRDHKPNDPSEQSRVESLGGSVKWHGYVDAQGEPIEPYGAYRINGNLAVARAIGDRDLRPYVTGEPEVKAFTRDDVRDEFIVIASDGLWDVFSSDEVVTFVKDVMSGEVGGRESWRSGGHSDTRVPIFEWSHQYKSDRGMIKAARKRRKLQIANYLVQEALYRGTSDNVSVIVVWLR